jgi:tetratricopeptide (TPR) repeat protein
MVAFGAFVGFVVASTQIPPLIVAGAAVLSMLTFARGDSWISETALWEEALRESPAKSHPRVELSKLVPARRALEILEEARRIDPANPMVAAELGRRYLELELPGNAIEELGRALRLEPKADLYLERGKALSQLGLGEAARKDFAEALVLEPCSYRAIQRLGVEPPAGCLTR